MTKKDLMVIEKTRDFINTIQSLGYTEKPKNGSSHRIFEKRGAPVLSIPNDRSLSTGTKRELVKLVLGEEYYRR
jgi:hypothetical protein